MNVKVKVTVTSDFCLICGKKNKGLHFNVASCRACAAFYRRSTRAGKEYKCQRGTRDCNLKTKVKGTPLCRFCRLQKCRQLGMTLDPDGPMTPTPSTSTLELDEKLIEPPNLSITSFSLAGAVNPPKKLDQKPANMDAYIEYKNLEEKIKEILAPAYATPITSGIKLTFLQQLGYGFQQFYEFVWPKSKNFICLEEIDSDRQRSFQARFMIELAKMLMYCKPFAELKFSDKILLYKHFRPIFNHIERFYASLGFSKDDLNGTEIPMLLYDNEGVELGSNKMVYFKNGDRESFAKTHTLWLPFRDKLVNLLYNPMKDLKLTSYELVYLAAQILWSTQEIIGLSSEAHRVAEEITDQISSELHNYYIYEMRLVNYAPRLVKMIKLIDGSKSVGSALKDVTIIAQVYNIYDFKAELSELVN